MLRIHTLGCLSVRADGRALSGAAAQPRRLAVLALLARAGERGVTREKLLATLWPDADDERGRRSLNQTVYAIRKELGSDEAILGLKELRLNADLVTSDVIDFEGALSARDFARAVEVYGGPFADCFHLPRAPEFEMWLDSERRMLAHAYEGALEKLAADALKSGDHIAALGWLRRLAAHDPLNARVALSLMQTLDAAGDRIGAIRHARIYELLVEQELDLPPDRDVVALASQLRRQLEAAVGSADLPAPASDASAGPLLVAPDSGGTASRELNAAVASEDGTAVDVVDHEMTAPVFAFHPLTIGPVGHVTTPDTPDVRLPAETGTGDSAPTTPTGHSAAAVSSAVSAIESSTPAASRGGIPRRPRRGVIAAIAIAGVMIAGVTLGRRVWRDTTSALGSRVVAVGRIADYRAAAASSNAAPIADMLATNVARARGVQVLSTVRLYEFIRRVADGRDSSAAAFAAAARDAGATELVDGALYEMADGALRLDLRRVDLATGDVRGAYTVSGRDIFAIADSGTARLVADLGSVAPAGSIADVTTRSLAAYRLYEEGLRAYARGDGATAAHSFEAAVAEDSMFAMAVYYSSFVTSDPRESERTRRLARAERLAAHATDRERLIILAGRASWIASPMIFAYADTLATRYPNEVYGPLYLGAARVVEGAFLEAIPLLERVIALDSLALRGAQTPCSACLAFQHLIAAHEAVDSLDAAERTARRWLRLQPLSGPARAALANVLDVRGRPAEALAISRASKEIDLSYDDALTFASEHYMFVGDFAAADRVLREQMQSGSINRQNEATWQLALSLRHQGRLQEALTEARRWRVAEARISGSPLARTSVGLEAQILLERGAYRESAALFDSVAQWPIQYEAPTATAYRAAWMLTQSAGARAATRDTATLARVGDTVRVLGALTVSGRNRRLHHHVRGLLLAARGDTTQAVTELRAAIYSPALGYTRTNFELGRLLLASGRPREAVSIVQPALRGRLEASQLYVSRTELHELLARAWDALGTRDSAVAHYRSVTSAWRRADPQFTARVQAAEARLLALGARP